MEEDNSLIAKKEANYRVAQEGEPTCSGCDNFAAPDKCKLVSGTISEKATCDLYSSGDLEDKLFGGIDG